MMEARDHALAEAVAGKAWLAQRETVPAAFERLPTMLTAEELWMLSVLAERLPLDGIVLDLGCFVGGSTYALAHGIRRSAQPSRHIHSFDLFELNEAIKHRYFYDRGLPFFPGASGADLYRIITENFADGVTAHVGNVMETLTPAWLADHEIALLFLDLCKNPQITDHVTRTGFGRLRPGTWIVQQDFIYEFTPWAVYPFWTLRDYLRFVGCTERHSAIFEVVAPIPQAEIERALVAGVGADELAGTLDAVSAWFTADAHRETLRQARQLVLEFPQLRDEWSLMRAHRKAHDIPDHFERWRRLGWSFADRPAPGG